jgi:hypothetical protein
VTGPDYMGDGPTPSSIWSTWGQALSCNDDTPREHARMLVLMVVSGSLNTSTSSPLTKKLKDSSVVLFRWMLHLEYWHLFHSVPISYNAPVLLHSLWLAAGVSCTQLSDHLQPAVFGSSAMKFHLHNSHLFNYGM